MHMLSIKDVPLCLSQCYSKNKCIDYTKLKQTIPLKEFEPEIKGLAFR